MKYGVYGINRVSKDFMYIFKTIEIVCFYEDTVMENPFGTERVYGVESAKQYKKMCDRIIICDFQKEQKEKRLISLGLVYGEDYVYEKDFFHVLDPNLELQEESEIIVWGTGKRAQNFYAWNKKYNVKYYIDTNKHSEEFNGYKVKAPTDIDDWGKVYIVIAVAKDNEIVEFLKKKGLEKYKNFVNSQELTLLPSKLLEETIFDSNCFELTCNTMLNHLEVLTGGSTFCCCTTFMQFSIGSIEQNTVKNIWNSPIHKIMCLSAVNKTYTFCKKDMCPLFIERYGDKGVLDLKEAYPTMCESPQNSVIGFDATCNLKCETCRHELHVATGKELEDNKRYADIIKNELLPDLKFLVMAGDGEVFASRTYKDVYLSAEMENLHWIRLLSNGMLFNEKNWREFSKNKKAKIMLTASIDAATKETYELIRKNGNFDVLKKNMEYASKLRKAGELSYFRINFVVQKKNYKEIIDFVKWGMELEADEVFFTKILNWGTYTKEEFCNISMMEEDGITPKPELEEILNNPIMNNRIVDLGTIRYAHKNDEFEKVDNYYRWELERKVEGLFYVF